MKYLSNLIKHIYIYIYIYIVKITQTSNVKHFGSADLLICKYHSPWHWILLMKQQLWFLPYVTGYNLLSLIFRIHGFIYIYIYIWNQKCHLLFELEWSWLFTVSLISNLRISMIIYERICEKSFSYLLFEFRTIFLLHWFPVTCNFTRSGDMSFEWIHMNKICINICISLCVGAMFIYIYIFKLVNHSQEQTKASISKATTLRCRGGHYSFPGIASLTLDLIMLSVKLGGIKYHFLSL